MRVLVLVLLLIVFPFLTNAKGDLPFLTKNNSTNPEHTLLWVPQSPADTIPNHLEIKQDIGYRQKPSSAVGSSLGSVEADDFNPGLISDPLLLIRGQLAGLQYNRTGGDPNRSSVLRVRGTSLSANPDPLIVIDGIIGADLQQVDPNDIAEITLLRDASATTIYGMRAASGALLIRTKNADTQQPGWHLNYHGQTAVSELAGEVPIMDAELFVNSGGTNLGAMTNWSDEITRTAWSQAHGLAVSYNKAKTQLRFSNNYRQVDGIQLNSGFRQWNSRLKVQTDAGLERLQINLDGAFNFRTVDYGFPEAFYYATSYNPTAPVRATAPATLDPDQLGGYFERLGLFDFFNPRSILDQNLHKSRSNGYNLGIKADYEIIPSLKITARFARQAATQRERAYYPTTSLFRGNAVSPTNKGRADYLDFNSSFNLLETYASLHEQNDRRTIDLLFGYSYQLTLGDGEEQSLGDLTDVDYDFRDALDPPTPTVAPLFQLSRSVLPEDKISALFARLAIDWSSGVFAQASLRGERYNRFGTQNPLFWLPALNLGIDLNKRQKQT